MKIVKLTIELLLHFYWINIFGILTKSFFCINNIHLWKIYQKYQLKEKSCQLGIKKNVKLKHKMELNKKWIKSIYRGQCFKKFCRGKVRIVGLLSFLD